MSMYYPGYQKARDEVLKMDEEDLLCQIDALYGRDNLPDDYTIEELRSEALAQTRREWTDTSSNEYDQVRFWAGVVRANRAAGRR